MWQGYRDSMYEIELKFLIQSLENKNFLIPQLSCGVPCINSDSVELYDRVDKTKGSPDKEKLRTYNEDKAQELPKPFQRLFNNLTYNKVEFLKLHSKMFMDYKFRCCMQCYLFLTQSKVYDRENQSLLKDVMKRRKEIYNKSKRSTLNENGKFN